MRILNILLLFFSIGLFAQEQKLSEPEIEKFQEKVMAHASNLESLQADFTQTKSMDMMESEAQSKGKVYFKSPEILKWEYREPYDYKVLFKEGELHIDDEGEKSIEKTGSNALFEKLGKLVSGSVNGKLLQDADDFDIDYFKEGENILANIKPKDERLSRIFSEIHLQFNGQNMVKSVKLVEDSGDFTLIEFSNIQLNKEIEEGVFE